ncbi:MAG: efflux RND transporter permease subunit, partial [Polyangiaceae bacterium]|nr:efflux RND transporter permease subunit [Polyangiaceae bacterium]
MIEFLVRHRAPVLLLIICTFIFGAQSYVDLPRENFPDVKIPFVMVTTPYVGVSPRDIENLVTRPIETEVAGLSGLEDVLSSSAEGVSVVTLKFQPDVDIQDALQKVRDRVSRAERNIPEDAEDTIVQEISYSDIPIMFINIAGDADETVLKELAEDLQDDLERLPGALKVPLSGGRTRAIRVQVDPKRLAHYELSLRDVSDAIGNENVNVPGGEVTAKRANFLVRIPGEFATVDEIQRVAITRRGDRPVFVRDVAQVVDSFEDRSTYSRMNGRPSVSLGVVKRAGANIVELATSAKKVTAEHAALWPKGVEYRVLADQSRDVGIMVNELQNNMILALMLVVSVLIFFMGVRNSLFVALAIPLSMLMSMMVFSLMGITLNMVVLFSLILVLGMLVDNAIVLVENIYRHLEMGKTPLDASIEGAKEVALPVAASTATTVAAFAPLLTWTGIMGEFMVYLPLTLIVVLLSSLVVALIMLPVLTSLILSPREKKKQVEENPKAFLRAYRQVLQWAIRHRFTTSFSTVIILIGSFVGYYHLNHGSEFFPETEPDRAIIAINAPDGTDLEETDRIVRQVEEILLAEKEVETYVAETGVGAGDPMQGGTSGLATNAAKITLNFFTHPAKAQLGDIPRREDSRQT